DCFGLFKVTKRFFKERRHRVWWASSGELGFCLPLVKNAAVIEPLVFVPQILESTFCIAITIVGTTVELIRDRKPKQAKCCLILRISSQDVAANRFGLARLI